MKKLTISICLALIPTLAACAFDPAGTPAGDDEVLPDAAVPETDALADATTDAAPACAGSGDDGLPCTTDTCVDGAWQHVSACDTGETCTATGCQAPQPADTHEIYCANSNGTAIEFRGNLKTGLVDGNPSWTPEYVAYGSDYGGAAWPGGSPNNGASVGNVVVTESGAKWTIAPWSFGDSVQGFTPYIASAGQVKWIDMGKWTVASGQYCTKSPGGSKLCTCETLPCTPANASTPSHCVN